MAKTEIQASVGLDTTKFQRGLAKADKGVKKFAKNAIRSFGAIAGAAGLSALASSAIRLGSEITNLAKLSGTGTTEFQEFAFAARSMGIENEKLADILKDVSDKVGDFLQTGGGPLADFFENIAPKVGVTAEQFRNLSGKDALQLYVSSLQKANLSQSEMTFFMEAIASDATLLLPLLAKNGEELNKFAKEAHELGLVLEKDTLDKLKAASVEMLKFKNILTVMTGKVLVNVIPILKMMSNGFGFIGDMVGVAASNALSFGQALGSIIQAVVAPAIKQFEALGFAIKAAGQVLDRDFDGAKKSLEAAKDAAGDSVDEIKNIPKEIEKAFDRLKSDGEAAMEVLGDSLEKRADNIGKAWTDLTGGMVEDTKDAAGKINNTKIIPGGNTIKDKSSRKSSASASGSPFESIEARDDLEKRRADKLRKAGQDIIDEKMSEFERESHTLRERRAERERLESELQDSIREDRDYNRTSKERFESQMNGSTNASKATADAAQGGPSIEAATPTSESIQYVKESAESLKAIETELTRTS